MTGRFDRRTAAFVVAGIVWAVLAALFVKPWFWAFLAIGLVIVARFLMGPGVRPVAFTIGFVVPNAIMVGVLLLGPPAADWWHRGRFDATAWKSQAAYDEMWPARLRMVDDLLERHDFHARAREEVVEVLGPPDQGFPGEWHLVYWLGPERGIFRIDSEWLVFKLDSRGRVVEYRLVTD